MLKKKLAVNVLAATLLIVPQAFGQLSDECSKARHQKSEEIWKEVYQTYVDHLSSTLKDNQKRLKKYLQNIEQELIPEFEDLDLATEEKVEKTTLETRHIFLLYKKLSDTDLKYLIKEHNGSSYLIDNKFGKLWDMDQALLYQANSSPVVNAMSVALSCRKGFELKDGNCYNYEGKLELSGHKKTIYFHSDLGYNGTLSPLLEKIPKTDFAIKICQTVPKLKPLKTKSGLEINPHVNYNSFICSILNTRTNQWQHEIAALRKNKVDIKNTTSSQDYSTIGDYVKSLDLKECKKTNTTRALPPEPKKKSKGVY